MQRYLGKGLGEKTVHAGFHAALPVSLGGMRRQRHDGNVPHHTLLLQRAYGAGGRVAIHFRHLAIHKYYIECAVLDRQQRLAPIGGKLNVATAVLQHRLRHLLIDEVVFRHQHLAAKTRRIRRRELHLQRFRAQIRL